MKATDGQNNVAGQAVTDANGSYSIKNLAAGAYAVSAQAPLGFKDPNPIQNVQVVDARMPQAIIFKWRPPRSSDW